MTDSRDSTNAPSPSSGASGEAAPPVPRSAILRAGGHGPRGSGSRTPPPAAGGPAAGANRGDARGGAGPREPSRRQGRGGGPGADAARGGEREVWAEGSQPRWAQENKRDRGDFKTCCKRCTTVI